ncbi:MAG: hypothetical protein WC942_04775 [Clostridia bacterium]|jgi:hypothetical protein
MANYRVFYPCHSVAIGEYASASGLPVHGVQSVNMTTSFSTEQVFELGQLDIYENIENLPDIELTVEKVLDGHPLIYFLASMGATTPTLLNRTNQRSDVFLSVFSDAEDNASGTPMVQAYCSGVYVNSLTYTLPVEGSATESVSFVGNDKIWITSSGDHWYENQGFAFTGQFDGTDAPPSGVQRRQHVKMGNAAAGGSIWPTNIPGVTVTTGSGYNVLDAGQYGAHIQDVTISVNLGREDLYELGRRKPYYRYANFPTEVETVINLTAGGDQPGDVINADSNVDNLSNEPIVIKLEDGTVFDLGTRNKLSNVSYSGGDTGGGVVSITYTFQNYNILTVTAPHDPQSL